MIRAHRKLKNRRAERARTRTLALDPLEKREMLTGITLINHELRIVGSASNDDAMLWVDNGQICAGLSTKTAPGKPNLDAGQRHDWDIVKCYPRASVARARFTGLAGDDWLDTEIPVPTRAYGGADSDTLEGFGKGVHVFFGEGGADDLFGDIGVDYLYGGGGNDTLVGNQGNDVLKGGSGNDDLSGGGNNDRLYAGSGQDDLHGGPGDDTLVSLDADANDTLFGGAGHDNFWSDSVRFWGVKATDSIKDASLIEMIESVHVVEEFANGADKTLDGDKLPDPPDAKNLKSFAGRPLFAPGGPSASDAIQGRLGDCWLISGLAAAAADPRAIQEAVVDLGDQTYAVELGGKFYRVDADLPTTSPQSNNLQYAKLGRRGSLWVPIMEKAYTYYKSQAGTYAKLAGGDAVNVFKALGGRGVLARSFDSGYTALTHIASELSKGKVVAIGIQNPSQGSPLIASHSYSAVKVNYLTIPIGYRSIRIPVSVVLRNPWGSDGKGSDGADDGLVTVTGDQLVASIYRGGIASAWV